MLGAWGGALWGAGGLSLGSIMAVHSQGQGWVRGLVQDQELSLWPESDLG